MKYGKLFLLFLNYCASQLVKDSLNYKVPRWYLFVHIELPQKGMIEDIPIYLSDHRVVLYAHYLDFRVKKLGIFYLDSRPTIFK